MSEMLGADVEELRALARDFSGNSQKLAQAQKLLDGAVNQLQRSWQGPDAQRFAAQWRGQHRGVIARTATMLDETATKLNTNAREQEQASSVASLGGSPGLPSKLPANPTPRAQFGPDFLAGPDSPFRDGWDIYSGLKLLPKMRASVFDMAAMLTKANRAGFFSPEAWKVFQARNGFSQFANMSSDMFDGNWHKAFSLAEGSKAFKFFDIAGKGLGGLGVGLALLDSVNHFANDEAGQGAYSLVKAGLGAASFAPPPVGTAAAIASGALFLYDNVPVIHDTANFVGGKIADGAVAATNAVVDGAGAVVDGVADGAKTVTKNVAKFFGF